MFTVDKKILDYNQGILKFWLIHYAGCSFPEYFGAKKGECGLELQQVPEEYSQLLLWFKEQKFESYLELGVGRGGSFLLNCLFQPNLKYADCVDNSEYWKDEQKKDIHEKVTWLNQNNKECGYAFYDYDTNKYFDRLEKDKMFDCIFIDADHSYEGVKKDFDNALKHINDGGYIIFHDIASVQCPGVMKIWKEAREQFKDSDFKEFIHGQNCGIGYIQIKKFISYIPNEPKEEVFHWNELKYHATEKEVTVNIPVKMKTVVYSLPKEIKKGVVIVETRPNMGLVETINNHFKYLPEDWGLQVFCSEENKHELSAAGRERWDSFSYSIVKYSDLNTYRYNRMLTNPMFWDSIIFDKIILTQTDARMLRKGVEEFMEWDYVGAPWTFCEHGGNGGFSFRNVKTMRLITDKFIWEPQQGNEDVWFCNIMKEHGIGRLAPRDVCSKFSVETIFKLGTLGCHAIEKYFGLIEIQKIMGQYE